MSKYRRMYAGRRRVPPAMVAVAVAGVLAAAGGHTAAHHPQTRASAPASAPAAAGLTSSHGPTGTQLVTTAETHLGAPYVYGAAGVAPYVGEYDCSGLIQYSLGQLGITAPRTSEAQWGWVRRISYSQLMPGALIFEQWTGDTDPAPGHVVIYAGGGLVVEAPHTGATVQVRPWSPNETQIIGYGLVPGLRY